MIKKIRIPVFILTIVLALNIIIPPKKAEAIPLVIPAVILLLEKLAISVGVTLLTVQQAKAFYENNKDNPIIQNITNLSVDVATSTVEISTELWTGFRDWMQGIFNPGMNTINYPVSQSWVNYPASPAEASDYPFQFIHREYAQYKLVCSTTPRYWYDATRVKGTTSYLQYIYDSTNNVWGTPTTRSSTTYNVMHEFLESNYGIYKDSTLTEVQTPATIGAVLPLPPVEAIGDAVLDNPAWDWDREDARRPVYIPEWALNPALNPDGTVNQEAVDEGLREWTGDVAIPTDRVINEEIPIEENPPVEVPGEVAQPTDWSIPQQAQLDFTPFKNLTLTNKFPFSIPWDIKTAVEQFNVTASPPKWVLPIYKGNKITIDFSIFETLAKVIRWGLLILFNIALILATRKIIG